MDKKIGFGIGGFVVGAVLGFLMRPSSLLVGQLPFEHVITRGANLKGMDVLLVPLAQQSFNVMVIISIFFALVGAGLGHFVGKKPSDVASKKTLTAACKHCGSTMNHSTASRCVSCGQPL